MTATLDNSHNPGRWLWRGLLLAVAGVLAWYVIALNMADFHAEKAGEGNRAAVDKALWWNDDHPRALALKGRWLIRDGKPAEAEPWLQRAVRANPADARPLVDLAHLKAEAGEQALADEMMATAHQLMPVEPTVQRGIGVYWLQRGEVARGIGHIAVALSGDADLREQYYPLLQMAAETPELHAALRPYALEPPPWWSGFFRHVVANAESADTVGTLVAMREESTLQPLEDWEREHYLQRLRRDGRVSDAYLAWVNGLSTEQMQELGYVFNGSFERPLANAGFGWFARPPKNSGIQLTTGSTYGVLGQSALRLTFNGKRVRFAHLYQFLFLGPGVYEASGMARPDGLVARRGLQWRVYCSTGEGGLLGESELLLGSGDWRRFGFEVTVPATCPGQILRLYSAGNREVDHELKGGIWFDDLRIRRLADLPEPAAAAESAPDADENAGNG